MNIKLILIISALILLPLIGVFILIKRNGKIPVEKVEVVQEEVLLTVTSNGIVKSLSAADLTFVSGGVISNINIEEGEKAAKNQLLASLNLYSQSQNSKALKDSRDIALRNKDLYIEQYSGDEYIDFRKEEEYKIKLRTLDEQISQAEATYRASLGQYNNLQIKAPFTGTAIAVNKEIGETALPGETIIKLADLDNLYFEVELDQEDIGKIKLDQEVQITLDAYEDQTFIGKVSKLPDFASYDATGNETFPVEIMLNNTDTPVLLGMTGDADIIIASTQGPANAVDYEAISVDDNGEYIWQLEDNLLAKYYVDTGLEGDFLTEIKNYDVNEKLLVLPQTDKIKNKSITEGDKAKVVE